MAIDLYGRRSIETRFVFYLTALVLIIMIFSCLVVTQEAWRFLELDSKLQAERLVDIAAGPDDVRNPEGLLRANPSLLWIRALPDRGPPVDLVRRPGYVPSSSWSHTSAAWSWDLRRGPGRYLVVLSKDSPLRQMRLLVLSFAWITGLTLIVHYFLARVMARVVLRPFKQFLEGMRNTMEGQYGYHFETPEPDEVGQLKQAFNLMQHQLQEKELMEQRLIEQEHMASLGHFAAGVAHEIRNPLASVSSLTQLLAGVAPENLKIQEYTQVILREVTRMDQAVSQLFSIARPAPPRYAPGLLSRTLIGVAKLMGFSASQRRVRLEVLNRWDGEFELCFDATKIEQVFINLVKNALEALGKGGTIVITLTYDAEGEQAVVTVEDDGPGVPPEIQDQLFNPFTTSKPLGTGIGLMVSTEIMAQHGGTLRLDRDRARGATFIVLLPNVRRGDPAPGE